MTHTFEWFYPVHTALSPRLENYLDFSVKQRSASMFSNVPKTRNFTKHVRKQATFTYSMRGPGTLLCFI